eukprot:TRINITY_DN28763_c0_g1_i1.p1 TRINITY_DN28763_c0_g1~~TRINITY_DN28763_c0_g1_i1.p1  ORF type:complete len:259 (-),score=13.11 TRINITY_DN28763_c0_g1_i1:219-968(-)
MSSSRLPRVLFLHGLESGPRGVKAVYIKNNFPEFLCPSLSPTWFLPLVLFRAIRAVKAFQPDVLVSSSFGSFVAMLLVQTGIYSGPVVMLAPAMSLLFKHRMWLPRPLHGMVIHGEHDALIPADVIRSLSNSYYPSEDDKRNQSLSFIIEDDDHSLNACMISQDKLKSIIQKVHNQYLAIHHPSSSSSSTSYLLSPSLHPHVSKRPTFLLWLYCLSLLILSFLREPFTFIGSLRMLARQPKRKSNRSKL